MEEIERYKIKRKAGRPVTVDSGGVRIALKINPKVIELLREKYPYATTTARIRFGLNELLFGSDREA